MKQKAKMTDKEDIKMLWAYAFNEQEPFLSRYFDEFWNYENALIIKKEHELCGALQKVPYIVSLRGSLFSASYIVGVSVPQKFRGQKYSTALMQYCLQEQKTRGDAISLLIPFNYKFYEKLGYSLCYDLSIYETKPENLPDLESLCTIKKMTLKDYELLNKAYETFCTAKNGYNTRTENDWKYIFFEHELYSGNIYAAIKDGKVCGYISYDKSGEDIYVREFIYNDKDSLYSLVAFMKTHFQDIKTLKIRTAKDNLLTSLLKEKNTVYQILPTVMARIVDIEKVLSKADIADIKIKVSDNLITENNGVYEKNGQAVIKTDKEEFDVALDIKALTQLVFGYFSAFELYFLGELDADEKIIKMLDKIFPKTKNYMNHIMEA